MIKIKKERAFYGVLGKGEYIELSSLTYLLHSPSEQSHFTTAGGRVRLLAAIISQLSNFIENASEIIAAFHYEVFASNFQRENRHLISRGRQLVDPTEVCCRSYDQKKKNVRKLCVTSSKRRRRTLSRCSYC